MDDSFKTSVAVMGGVGAGRFGLPIGLSTATWAVGGSGTTNAATAAGVMDPTQWNKGALTPAGAQNYPGDGVIKYLEWEGNGPAELANFNNQAGTGSMGGLGSMPSERDRGTIAMASNRFSIVAAPPTLLTVPPVGDELVFLSGLRSKRRPTSSSIQRGPAYQGGA